jgi:apolipoprotein D and lipocalin family protein
LLPALLTAVFVPVTLTGCVHAGISTKGNVPLATVDLQRMYGGWYIIAAMPNPLDRGLVGSYDVFSPGQEALHIHEDFYMQRGGFHGVKRHFSGNFIRVLPNSGNADWRVSPIWPLSLPFQIVYVDPDYRFVLFGEQNRKWGWVYSRTQIVSNVCYEAMLGKFHDLGWDTSLFREVIQKPDQIGLPGFWSEGVTNSSH